MNRKLCVLPVSLLLLLTPIGLGAQDTHEPAVETDASGTSLEDRARREIEELHHFFQQWFNGTVENTDEVYARFTGVLAEGFVIVSPDGQLRERTAVIDGLRGSYAPADSEPVRVWVENVELRRQLPSQDGELVVVTYQEWLQRGEARRGRLSTALLRESAEAPNGLMWLHVHETWLPPAVQTQ